MLTKCRCILQSGAPASLRCTSYKTEWLRNLHSENHYDQNKKEKRNNPECVDMVRNVVDVARQNQVSSTLCRISKPISWHCHCKDNNNSASIQEKDQLWMEWNIMCRMFILLTIYVFMVYISLVLYTLHL